MRVICQGNHGSCVSDKARNARGGSSGPHVRFLLEARPWVSTTQHSAERTDKLPGIMGSTARRERRMSDMSM